MVKYGYYHSLTKKKINNALIKWIMLYFLQLFIHTEFLLVLWDHWKIGRKLAVEFKHKDENKADYIFF